MTPNLSNITVNGKPLTFVVNEMIANEINQHRKSEIASQSWHRPASGTRFRNNISGSRTKPGRVIYSAASDGVL